MVLVARGLNTKQIHWAPVCLSQALQLDSETEDQEPLQCNSWCVNKLPCLTGLFIALLHCVLLSAQIAPPPSLPLALLRERKNLSNAAGSAPFKLSYGIRGIAEWPLTPQCRKGLQSNKSRFYTPHSLTRTWQEIINLSKELKQARRKMEAQVN